MTTHLNDFNTKLQQNGQCANDMYKHIKAFQNKLRLSKAHIQKGDISHFRTLKETGLLPEKKTQLGDQLENLINEFLNRFQDFKSHEHLFDIFPCFFPRTSTKHQQEFNCTVID